MKRHTRGGALALLLIVIVTIMLGAAVRVRIKDIAFIRGIRENQLVGYGLVVGLNGRGDSPQSVVTRRTIRTFLKNIGINIDDTDILSANAAVVVVTAVIPPFSNGGDRIDVTVSSLADARTLAGGVLIQTPLRAADNQVYAVAQGQVLVGGSSDTTLNVGRIPKGAIVERGVGASFMSTNHVIRIATRDRDFATVNNIGIAVTNRFPTALVRVLDPSTVDVTLPAEFRPNPISFIAQVELLEVDSDTPARVVVDGKSGTVVMGENVRISTVAVSYNGIKISVGFDPLSGSGREPSSFVLGAGANVGSLVEGLNKIGARAQDIINILQAIEKAGALKARLIIM